MSVHIPIHLLRNIMERNSIKTSAKRFGKVEADGEITIMLPLTHQDIADIAGISRETASLAINKLEKKKIITYKKRLIAIKNIETLEEELGLSKKEIKVPIAS